MSPAQRPDKQQVHEWWIKRRGETSPPPSPDEIRRQLGWAMCEAERDAVKRIDKGE